MTREHSIDRKNFQQSTTQTICELHITGGARAVEQGGGWSWYPILVEESAKPLNSLPIQQITALADALGSRLDQHQKAMTAVSARAEA